jgi:hypothetical protein
MKGITSFIFFNFCVLNFNAQSGMLFDTTVSHKDLDKIKSFSPFIKAPANCNVSQCYVYFKHKGKTSVKIYKSIPPIDKHMLDFFDEAEKGDGIKIEVSQTSCKQMLGKTYLFNIQ